MWFICLNIFNFKIRLQAFITLNLMNSLSILTLTHLTSKSLVCFNYELSFDILSKSELWLHINKFTSIISTSLSVDKPSYLFILMTLILVPFSLMTN